MLEQICSYAISSRQAEIWRVSNASAILLSCRGFLAVVSSFLRCFCNGYGLAMAVLSKHGGYVQQLRVTCIATKKKGALIAPFSCMAMDGGKVEVGQYVAAFCRLRSGDCHDLYFLRHG